MKPSHHPESFAWRIRVACVAALALVVSLAVSAAARAEEFQPGNLRLENIAPDDCYLFATFGGVDHCVKNAKALGLHQLWEEPEVQAFAKDLVGMIRGKVEQPGFPVAPILDLFRGRTAIVVGDQTLVKGVIPVPAVVVGIDTGNRTESFRQTLAKFLEGHQRDNPSIVRSSFTAGKFEITSLFFPQARASLCYTFADSLFLVGLNKYYLQKVLANIGQGSRTLGKDEAFQRTMTKLGTSDATLLLYLNFRGFTNKVAPWMPPEALEYFDLFGIRNVDAVAIASAPAGNSSREVLYVDAPGEKTGLLRVLSPRPSGMKALALAPPETAVFLSASLDLSSAYQEAMRILRTLDESKYREFQSKIQMGESQLGLSLEKDILAALGSEVSLYAGLPAGGGFIPEVVGVLELHDRAAFDRCLGVLLKIGPNLQFKSLEFEGSEIKYLAAQPGGPPITPAYTVAGDLLVIGTSPNSVKQVIHARTEKRPSLADSPDFQAVRARLSKDAACMDYVDLKRLLVPLYATATPFLQGLQGRIDQMGIPVNMALLPTADTLAKHMSPAASAWSSDRDGLLMESISPLGTGAVAMLAVSAVASFEKAAIPAHRGEVSTVRVRRSTREGSGEAPAAESPSVPAGEKAAPASSASRDADRYFAREEWGKAAEAYRALVESNPKEGRAWFNLGFSLHSLGKYDEAIKSFERSTELGHQTAKSTYNIACGYAMKNNKDKAFEWLRKALDAGVDRQQLESDTDLDKLRDDPRFKELSKKIY